MGPGPAEARTIIPMAALQGAIQDGPKWKSHAARLYATLPPSASTAFRHRRAEGGAGRDRPALSLPLSAEPGSALNHLLDTDTADRCRWNSHLPATLPPGPPQTGAVARSLCITQGDAGREEREHGLRGLHHRGGSHQVLDLT